MDKNLSWTSSLGDAYYNQQQDVMDAVQVMRQRAQQAGNLKTTPQQTVTAQDSEITIAPPTPMSFTFPLMIPGWSTDIPSLRGRGGTVSRNLVCRSVPLIWNWIRNRLLWRFWMGLALLGIRLVSPLPHL